MDEERPDGPPAGQAHTPESRNGSQHGRPQNLLDRTVELDAKGARIVDEARARAKERHTQVRRDIETLAKQLDDEAQQAVGQYRQEIDAQRAAALAALDERLAASLEALEAVKAQHVESAAAEVARLLEQPGDGH